MPDCNMQSQNPALPQTAVITATASNIGCTPSLTVNYIDSDFQLLWDGKMNVGTWAEQ